MPRVALVQGAGREEEVGLVGKCHLEPWKGLRGHHDPTCDSRGGPGS